MNEWITKKETKIDPVTRREGKWITKKEKKEWISKKGKGKGVGKNGWKRGEIDCLDLISALRRKWRRS